MLRRITRKTGAGKTKRKRRIIENGRKERRKEVNVRKGGLR